MIFSHALAFLWFSCPPGLPGFCRADEAVSRGGSNPADSNTPLLWACPFLPSKKSEKNVLLFSARVSEYPIPSVFTVLWPGGTERCKKLIYILFPVTPLLSGIIDKKWLVIVTFVVGDGRREEGHFIEPPAAASRSHRAA